MNTREFKEVLDIIPTVTCALDRNHKSIYDFENHENVFLEITPLKNVPMHESMFTLIVGDEKITHIKAVEMIREIKQYV